MSGPYKDWVKENFKLLKTDKTWWVFVLHEPTDTQVPKGLKDLLEVWWQVEEGGLRHRRHLQGVARFRYPKSRAQLREQLPAWWQPMHGTPEQAVRYCTKLETRVEGPYHHSNGVGYFQTLEAINNKEDKVRQIRTLLTGPLPEGTDSRPWIDMSTGF